MAWVEVFELNVPRFPYQMHLHGLSDLQIGSMDCSERTIRQRVQEIVEDPIDSATIVLGDVEDEDRPSTRGIRKAAFAERGEVIERDAQKHLAYIDKFIVPHLMPLQKTKYGILGMVAGHHWTQITPSLNSCEYICNRITELSGKRVHYLGEMSSFIDLRFRSKDGKSIRSVGFIQHGDGGGQTKGSTLSKLDRATQSFEADFYVRAHDCQLVATKTDKLYAKEVKAGSLPDIMSKTVVQLNLGSATQGYQPSKKSISYVERGMMRPSTMGWGSIYMNIRKAWAFEDQNQSYKIDMKVVI
jgi:hypothetical protein